MGIIAEDRERFQSASETAEGLLRTLAAVNKIDLVSRIGSFNETPDDFVAHCLEVLREARGQMEAAKPILDRHLIELSRARRPHDLPIHWQTSEGLMVCTTAHEAALGIAGVYLERFLPAIESGIEPPSVNLADDEIEILCERLRWERANALHEPEASQPQRKKPGRKPKTETGNDTKILAALQQLMGTNDREHPPMGKDVRELAGVGNVSLFIQKHFGKQAMFEDAWRRGAAQEKILRLILMPSLGRNSGLDVEQLADRSRDEDD